MSQRPVIRMSRVWFKKQQLHILLILVIYQCRGEVYAIDELSSTTTMEGTSLPSFGARRYDASKNVALSPVSAAPTAATTQNTSSRRPVAIVTGGTRGIGSGIATSLARNGFDLLLTYNTNEEAATKLAQLLLSDVSPNQPMNGPECSCGCRVVCVGGDMTLPETRDRLFETLDREYLSSGSLLQVLVHNAGQYVGMTSSNSDGLESSNLNFGDGSLLQRDGSENGVERVNFDTIRYYQRLYGEAWIDLCERSLQRMNDPNHGGTIIGISSPGVNPSLYRPDRTYSAPGSGKTVMEYSMRIYAKVVANRNINVNVVVPGLVQSSAWDMQEAFRENDEAGTTQTMLEGLAMKLVPLGRILQPSDIGEVVAFLCSPSGRFITGTTLPVDGGMHIN